MDPERIAEDVRRFFADDPGDAVAVYLFGLLVLGWLAAVPAGAHPLDPALLELCQAPAATAWRPRIKVGQGAG